MLGIGYAPFHFATSHAYLVDPFGEQVLDSPSHSVLPQVIQFSASTGRNYWMLQRFNGVYFYFGCPFSAKFERLLSIFCKLNRASETRKPTEDHSNYMLIS